VSTPLWAIGSILGATVAAATASFLLKKGVDRTTLSWNAFRLSRYVMGGIGLYLLSSAFFFVGLLGGPLSVLYPFTAAQYVWVALIAHWLLGERISPWKKAGIGLIVLGVILVGLGS
jgi:drug/metabolite transporter (DMT)-like permease